jgi:histidinol phosphate phosphatase HisJ family
MIDSHTHTFHSHDGKTTLPELIAAAKEKGLSYLAITEHLDRDYYYCCKERFARQLNLKRYSSDFEKNKNLAGDMPLAFGVECGYLGKARARYVKDFSKYNFDVIINSVHTVDGGDLYFMSPEKLSDRNYVFGKYLEAVLESLDGLPDYDIVGHVGYVARYVKFENRSLYTPEFYGIIDDILGKIIEKDKTLELNTNVKDLPYPFLPEPAILKRYFALGGRNITFSSDAHIANKLCFGYETAAEEAKKIGFTEWTTYLGREKRTILIKSDL